MPLTRDSFAAHLAASGLLTDDDLAPLLTQHPAADTQQLADLLVHLQLLTPYQAHEALAGRAETLLLGNYLVLDKLGQGGMGLVLQARHRRMNRLVALKVLSPAITKTPEAQKRFQREVEAAARLHHPNIVTAHDADEVKDTHFLVMEYIDGTDLSVLVRTTGPLPVDQAVRSLYQTAQGLAFAHEHGVIHRDIKPANLLLDRHGTIKILDMGLARIEGETGPHTELTRTGAVMGTVDYMAPEQALSTRNADARSDIYSLGVTLWYLLTGRAPYEGDSLMARLLAHRDAPIPSLQAARPDVPAPLDDLFQKMIAKRPDDRCQSMTEVLAALDTAREVAPETDAGKTFPRVVLAPAPTVPPDPQPSEPATPAAAAAGEEVDPFSPTRGMPQPVGTIVAPSPDEVVAVQDAVPAEGEGTVTIAPSSEGTSPDLSPLPSDGAPDPIPPRRRRWFLRSLLTLGTIAAVLAVAFAFWTGSLEDLSLFVPQLGGPIAAGSKPGSPQPSRPRDREDNPLTPGPAPSSERPAAPAPTPPPATPKSTSPPVAKPAAVVPVTPAPAGLEFDGVDDSVDLFPLELPRRELTFEVWAVPAPEPGKATGLPLGQVGEFGLAVNAANHWVLDLVDSTPKLQGITFSIARAQPGVRAHVAAVVAPESCRLYVDGKLAGTKPTAEVLGDVDAVWSRMMSVAPFSIGSRHLRLEGRRRFWKGRIDEARVSSKARYDRDFPLPPDRFEADRDTLALYHIEEGQGETLNDSSGNNRHGRILGATWVPAIGGPAAPQKPAPRSND